MRAVVAAGAGEKISGQDWKDEPGEHHQFDGTRLAAHNQVKREGSERDHAAQKPRRDEGAMPRRRQRIALGRRVNQGLDVITYRREQAHGPKRTSGFADALPFMCQTIVSEAA